MTVTSIELLPAGANATDASASACEWPLEGGKSSTLRTSLSWDLAELGAASPVSKDLLRIVTAAHVADRRRRPPASTLVRNLRITVHVEQPSTWTTTILESVADLLNWLTGDDWAVRCVQAAPTPVRADALPLPIDGADDICLLSGGLDSYCGALIRHTQPGTPLFLGHKDTATAVRHAQDVLTTQLAALRPARVYMQHRLHPTTRMNGTPKSRSLLFMALAIVAADGLNATRVLVPENGFTSINPPLEPSRAGVMTTRSTHPWTFHELARILQRVGLGNITVLNPHASQTKGELVRQALSASPTALAAAAHTVSCAKINAGRPTGGNPNLQCGACIACQVRRSAFAAANLTDPTSYAITGGNQVLASATRRFRRHDIAAVRASTAGGIAEHRILGNGLWPDYTDFDAVLDLCHRGLQELSLVTF
jgi:7-cyano-7-deazaguanine synthase in queuosine biosynthesis